MISGVTPLRRTSEHRTRPYQAYMAWVILIGAAMHKSYLTYAELAKALGYSERAANTLSDVLDHIYAFCKVHDLPLLTVLVEGDQSGRPNAADGLYHDPSAERRRVHKFNWYDVHPPSAEALAESYRVFWPTQS